MLILSRFNLLSASLFLASLSITRAALPTPSQYPPLDKISPANPNWTHIALKNVPSIPLNTKQLPHPDWSKDIITCSNEKQWGISYDDGPSVHTLELLKVLADRKINATFFIVGSRAMQNPDILLKTFQAGHQLALHTWSHSAMTTIPNDQIIADIVFNAMIVKQIIGLTPRFIRLPYGDIDDRVRAIIHNLGLVAVAWNVDSNDAAGATDVAAQFKLKANAGPKPYISLEHDILPNIKTQAAEALDAILSGTGGYKIMSISECLNQPAYDEGFWERVGTGSLPATANTAPPPLSQSVSVPGPSSGSSHGASSGSSNGAGKPAASNDAMPNRFSVIFPLTALMTALMSVLL
ncbi:hypothetical protein BATDEDRAFT_37165 [Batrachochytrium dendrobatidis JAM81]|uniref:chitin deacetylase n=2 Tax=Batrachochytrium dendrobatidis TaxID=109871 RepID=F4P770_BATDJ|nr:uncharacterized protein BATDEDRAFT_37165 [Batrachochytrium dendrobatidis JAM81]EGF78832.1 hypothetical protein BATDEDRAFT_37165 [Batrachochytrium dendrobatidis JAM81]KAJ8325338.1 chitin deacetylase [Batrachochytrium dendrobatidis]KAK5667500.1 chitin deacetylase [Batrachochytrium dendrobatidis]|eukprot:XP_006680437.1 hypothetical protein BATDEDRAFT_37165 [Batrachochytrium dendrobatidis JAM81]